MRKYILLTSLCFVKIAAACTSFGVVTDKGTIIGKNRDYYYSNQNFKLVGPIKQFEEWYGNPSQHNNKFYALVSKDDIKFGVNEFGLTAIEEDPPFPSDANSHRRYKQPYQGYSEGMILYGILQNFNTVDEIIPYIDRIFSTAAPNYYQIADKNTILTVEVAYGNTDIDPKRPYTYKVINKINDFFTHTNTYQSREFTNLNQLGNTDSINGSNNRLQKINNYVSSTKDDFSQAFNWYLDTQSTVGSANDKNYCLNTSIFRSNTKDLNIINHDTSSDTVYGTVSSFMVQHTAKDTYIYLRILNSLYTQENGDQEITFNEIVIPLDSLFKSNKLDYKPFNMKRKTPNNGICY